MKKLIKVIVGDWEVCCEDMSMALLNGTVVPHEDFLEEKRVDEIRIANGVKLSFCPFCGKEIRHPIQDVKPTIGGSGGGGHA